MARCVVFLQNAWSWDGGGSWERSSWLRALWRSKTGINLKKIFPHADAEDSDVWVDNTTPEVASKASGVCVPDEEHVRAVLAGQSPEFVLACGKQAGRVVPPLWPGRLLLMPHPAWRLMSNEMLAAIRDLIDWGEFGRDSIVSRSKGDFGVMPIQEARGSNVRISENVI